jgi:tRNA isopentenyl-2-thiomethyl-A-37 hydroxylase MiaE
VEGSEPEGSGPVMSCTYPHTCVGGRRPAGLFVAARAREEDAIAGWLATTAHLEAASVPAFVELASELRLHGAPRPLVRAAMRAADDERRHALIVGRLAMLHGAEVAEVVRTPTEPRDLVALLLDDVVEGCVREAYAALVAAHQAENAPAGVARIYAGIAADEARHALLSFAVADWASARVPVSVRRRADESRREAAEALASEVVHEPGPLAVLGLPEASRAVELASRLAA